MQVAVAEVGQSVCAAVAGCHVLTATCDFLALHLWCRKVCWNLCCAFLLCCNDVNTEREGSMVGPLLSKKE